MMPIEVMFPWWSLLGLGSVFAVAVVAFLKSWRDCWAIIGVASAISSILFCFGFAGAAGFYACIGVERWLLIGLGIVLGPFYIIGGVRFVCAPKLRKC